MAEFCMSRRETSEICNHAILNLIRYGLTVIFDAFALPLQGLFQPADRVGVTYSCADTFFIEKQ